MRAFLIKWIMPLVGVGGTYLAVSSIINRQWLAMVLGLVLVAAYAVVLIRERGVPQPRQ